MAKVFEGDTGCYGYIYEPTSFSIGDGIFVGTGKRISANKENEALTRAKLNANYLLIEEAYKIGADSILEPVYTVETITSRNKVQYKVCVRAKAIQIKTDK